MKGRQVIKMSRTLDMGELEGLFETHWTEEWTKWKGGFPSKEYISLPSTELHRTLIYPKRNALVLITYFEEGQTKSAFVEQAAGSSLLGKALGGGSPKSREQDRVGPAEDNLLAYTQALKELLAQLNLLA